MTLRSFKAVLPALVKGCRGTRLVSCAALRKGDRRPEGSRQSLVTGSGRATDGG
ncbi:hypothetical protein [Sphingobium ummariense]